MLKPLGFPKASIAPRRKTNGFLKVSTAPKLKPLGFPKASTAPRLKTNGFLKVSLAQG